MLFHIYYDVAFLLSGAFLAMLCLLTAMAARGNKEIFFYVVCVSDVEADLQVFHRFHFLPISQKTLSRQS